MTATRLAGQPRWTGSMCGRVRDLDLPGHDAGILDDQGAEFVPDGDARRGTPGLEVLNAYAKEEVKSESWMKEYSRYKREA